MIAFSRSRLFDNARLNQIATGLSTLYWGCAPGAFEGDERSGIHLYDNGQGDRYALAWRGEDAVGLVFAHESNRSRYRSEGFSEEELCAEEIFTSLIDDAPWSASLLDVARDASVALQEIATAAVAIVDRQSWMSDVVDVGTVWANGLEMLVPFGLPGEHALLGERVFQPWSKRYSLDEPLPTLCLRWHERLRAGPFAVLLDERDILLASGTIERDAVPYAVAALAEVGITLDV